MVRTYDPTGYRINSRSAEQIAAGQAAQHQQALAENQAAGSIQTRQAAPVGLTPEQQAAQNNATLYTPSAAEQQNGGVIEASRNARLDGGTYAATGEARPAATPEQRAQNQQNLQGIMNPGYGVSDGQKRLGDRLAKLQNGGDLPLNVEDPVVRSQIQANNAQEAASIQQQLGQMQDKEKKKGNESAAADAAATNLNPQQAGASAFFQNLPPEAAALAPYFENILSTISDSQEANAEATNAMLNGGTIDVNGQQVKVKGFNSAYDEMDKKVADMEAGYNTMQEGIQTMLDKVKEQQEKTISEQEDAAKDRLAWQETQMLRQVAKQKQDAVDSRIARLALTGGFGSDGGLREIEETRMEYENRMDDIKTEFGVQKTELAAKFTGLYLEASNNHLTSSIQNIKETAAALERIAGQSMSNKQARNTAEQNVLGKFLDTQAQSRKEYAGTLKDYAVQMQTMLDKDKEDKRAQESLGWTQLKQARDIYGPDVPQAMIDSIAKKLPGVNVREVLQSPTADELKKRGSGGSGAGGFYVPTGAEAPTAAMFTNVSPQQLNEAVSRIFAPANYGGTAGEREDRKQDYLNRIASGENPASIMASLQNDYWSSQKGAPRTAHDGRLDAQSSADALLSYVDFYNISGEDDGPLGRLDSKVEWAKSWFGQSSEEYNNLATNVGNIRARIIKENYGAAVTPQELTIAQSYIPDLNDKGEQFVTKLHNLKAYNAYLDAKQFAANAGLPLPTPPAPVSMTGGGMSGPAKYSSSDITSALYE